MVTYFFPLYKDGFLKNREKMFPKSSLHHFVLSRIGLLDRTWDATGRWDNHPLREDRGTVQKSKHLKLHDVQTSSRLRRSTLYVRTTYFQRISFKISQKFLVGRRRRTDMGTLRFPRTTFFAMFNVLWKILSIYFFNHKLFRGIYLKLYLLLFWGTFWW